MRSMKWLAVPAVLTATVVFAQKPVEPKNPPGTKDAALYEKAKIPALEDLLSAALQHSPEVQVAEAKLKEAEAQLRQIRLQVAQKLVDLHTTSETQRKNLIFAEEEFKRVAQLRQAGTVSTGEFAETERKLQMLKGQVAQLEASVATLTGNLPALNRVEGNQPMLFRTLGGGGGGGDDGGIKPRWPRQAMVEKLTKALEQPIAKFNRLEGVSLRDLIEYTREQSKDISILAKLDGLDDQQVTINFKGDITFGNFLEVLLDTIPDLRIVVRDYGLFFTVSSSMPDDGVLITDFRQKRAPAMNTK